MPRLKADNFLSILPAFVLTALPLVAGLRSNVVINGTTPAPDFTRLSGEFAPSCPESHPFPYNDFKFCCSEKLRNNASCGGKTGMLQGRDHADCCNDAEPLQCPHTPPCKMHEKGYERQTKHVLMIGSEGTHDINIDPKGKTYGDRAQSTGGNQRGAMRRQPKEYPVGSSKVVACCGANTKPESGFLLLSLRECERYDFVSNQWESFPQTVEARQDAQNFLVNGVLWIMGGFDSYLDSTNTQRWITLDSTEYYDETTSAWKLGPPLPAPIRSSASVVISNTEVLFLGCMISPKAEVPPNVGPHVTSKVILFDTSTGHHEYKKEMTVRRALAAAATITLDNGHAGVVVAGGIDESKTLVDTVQIYDLVADEWLTTSIKLPSQEMTFFNNYASIDGKLWYFGGGKDIYPNVEPVDEGVWTFNGESAVPTWTKKGEIPASELDYWNRPVAVVVTVTEPY